MWMILFVLTWTVLSQSLRKSGRFLLGTISQDQLDELMSQSLRKSGRFLRFALMPGLRWRTLCLNPFVSQVGFFDVLMVR